MDIFISYSHKDQGAARRFAEALVREGFDVWWDTALRAGEAFDEVTERALKSAHACVVLWSKHSVNSRWVRAEATLADRHRKLKPVMIEPCERPIIFELLHTAELEHWCGDRGDPAWRSFVEDVRSHVVQRKGSQSPAAASVADGQAPAATPDTGSAAPEWIFGAQEQDAGQVVRRERRPFVGRNTERSRLDKMLQQAIAGHGALVLLGGEPGVGKTRLATEILEDGRERGMLALTGHAYEEETAPLVLASEILDEMVRLVPRDRMRALLGDDVSELSRLLPALRQLYPDVAEPAELPPDMRRRLLFRSVVELLTRASAARPIVMLLDDLHWADESSLLLLEQIASRVAELPILMIGTYRDVEADHGEPFDRSLTTLVRQRLAERITVNPFGERAVTEILAALGGATPPAGLARAIHDATEGNVFFIEETFRHLSEVGKLFDEQGGWRPDIDVENLDVPDGVRLVTARRLERLSKPTRKVLSVASVIGLRFPVAVLEAAAPDPERVLEALEEAAAAHLLKPSEGGREIRYEFVHALARQTLLSDLSPVRRQRMHVAVAEAIEQSAGSNQIGSAADIAHHLVEAGSSADPGRTIRWLTAAGENAAAAAALEEAFRYFDTALGVETEQPSESRGDLLQRRAWARMALGDPIGCESDLSDAIAVYDVLGLKTKSAGATASLGVLLVQTARPGDALTAVERAREFVGDGDSPERSRLLSTQGFAVSMTPDPHEAEPCHEAAVAIARRLEDRVLLADVLQARAFSDQFRIFGDRLVERATEAAALRRELGQPFELAYCLFFLMNGLTNSGRFGEAARVGDELLPLAERTGAYGATAMAYLLRASADVARGDVEGMQESLRLSTQFFEAGGFPFGRDNDGHALGVLLLAGKDGLAREALDRIAATGFPEGQTWSGQLEGYRLSGKAHLGDRDILEEYHRRRSCLPRPGRAMSGGSVLFLAGAIEALAVAGEMEEAGKLYPLIAEFVENDIGLFAFTSGLLERFAGIAAAAGGDWQSADRHFQHCLTVVDDERPHRVEQARVRYWYARMLLSRGGSKHRQRAQTLLAEARVLSKVMGLHGLLRWIDALEGEAAADLSPVAGSGTDEQRSMGRRGTFVGRDAERSALNEMLERAKQGRGALVVLGGEPGVGKTRLATEILEDGRERGMLAFTGHAYEGESAPFVLASGILEEMLRLVPRDELRGWLAEDASELSRLLPELRRIYPDVAVPEELPPEHQQRALFRSVQEFLARAAGAAPIVMLLDDIHWADESSLKLLEHVVTRLDALPILIIGTYRDADTEMGAPFIRTLASLVRQRLAERLTIHGFDAAAVEDLLTQRGGSAPPHGLVEAIHRGTEGNAFFVEEVFRHLSEEGALFDEQGRWKDNLNPAALDVPEGVRLVTGRRLERLQEGTRKVLTTAAGIGLRFELEMLEAAFGDPDAVLDGVEEAESAQLILATAGRRGSRYEFSHALVRQTLLTELSAPRLQRLHLTIADAMEAMYGEHAAEHAADIAHQLHEAGTRADADRTRRYLKLAGEQAIAAAAPDEALVAFDRALALTGANAPDQRALLLYQRGFALRALGRHAEATDDWFEALPVLEASGHTAAVADICRQVAYIYLWALRIEDALALAKRGLEAVGDAPSRERSRLEAVWGIVHSVKADCEVADRWIRGAVALGTEQGDLRLLGGELMQLQLLQFEHSQRIADMVETGGRAIDLVRRYGTPWEQASTIGATLLGWVWAGDFASQKRHVDPLLPVAEAEGNIGAMFHCLCGSALAALASDDLADAIEKATRGIDLAAQYQLAWGTVASLYRGVARMWAGQFEGAAADFEECVVRRLPAPCHLGLEPAAALYGFAMMGDPRAAELYDRDDFPLPVLGRDNAQGAWHWCIAKIQAAVLLGRPEEAGAWLPHVEQLMRQGMMVTSGQGLAAKVAGIAAAARGDREVAERHFETALRQADELPYHTEQAEVRRWYAWALERFGRQHDRARVEALRAASAAKFQALGGFQPPMRPGEQIGL